jgi:predicted ATPase
MLTALLGREDEGTVPLKRLILERTEGNPFFMEEMIQALFEEGVMRNGAVSLAKPLKDIRASATVQAVIGSRIDRLAAEKGLLQTLAVLGREFSLGLIKRAIQRTNWSRCYRCCAWLSSSTSSSPFPTSNILSSMP